MEKQTPKQKLKSLQEAVKAGNKDMQSTWKLKFPLLFSFLNSALLFLYAISGLFFSESMISFLQGDSLPPYFHFWKENLVFFYEVNVLYYVFLFLLGGMLLYACTLIWNGHRTGVNLYAFGRVASLILPSLFMGMRGVALGDIMLGVLFIAYYYLYMFRNLLPVEPLESSEEPESEIE